MLPAKGIDIAKIRSKLQRPNHTPKRFFNAALNFLSKSWKSPHVFGLPEQLIIEPTNICDLKCPLCPAGTGKLRRNRGYLSYENFQKIIDEIGPYIYYVVLTDYGEPFLNKDIIRMISYAKEKKSHVSIKTNGQQIDESMAASVVAAKPDEITVALDGVTQASYEKYRVAGKFEKAAGAIINMRKEKIKQASAFPALIIQFIVMKHNEHEVGQIRALAKELQADRLVLKRMYNLLDFPDRRPILKEKLAPPFPGSLKGLEEYAPVNPVYRAHAPRVEDSNFCAMAWNYPAITWDGDLYPCCFDCGSLNMGNVFEAGFRKTWNNHKFIALRKGIAGSRDTMPVCADCRMSFSCDNIEDGQI